MLRSVGGYLFLRMLSIAHRRKHGAIMPRRNTGPRLRFLEKRGCFYICWTEAGRSRERSTGTSDRKQAEVAFAEFLRIRTRSSGPRDPSEILVTDVLADYAEEHGPHTSAPWRVAYAVTALAGFWEGRTVVEVSKEACRRYGASRGRSTGTVRRELGVLRAAINYAHSEGRLTRPVIVLLPAPPAPRERWLTRSEAARLTAGALGFTFAPCSDTRTRRERWVVWDREGANARLYFRRLSFWGSTPALARRQFCRYGGRK